MGSFIKTIMEIKPDQPTDPGGKRMRSTAQQLPERAIDPPCPDEAGYARNVRNGIREEIMDAISLIDSRLGELDSNGFISSLHSLAMLREYLRRDYED